MAPSQPLQIFPQAAPPAAFSELHARLKEVASQIVDLPVDRSDLVLSPRVRLLEVVHEYARSLRLADAFRHTKPSEPLLDDHDWLASYLLYRYLDYDRLYHESSAPGPSLLNFIHEVLPIQMGSASANLFSEKHPRRQRPAGDYAIGILTALPHEYHSVLRRLDAIEYCTGAGSAGFELLDRSSATDEPRRYKKPEPGWCVGRFGAKRVLVMCTGSKGKDAMTDAVDLANRLLLLPRKHWIVVGICATTDDTCSIGTVLVSTGAIYNVKRTHSQGFETEGEIAPTPFEVRDTLEMATLFRRPPKHEPESIAKPRRVPVKAAPFACTNEVINMKADRDALHTHLCSTLPASVHFGIEMEGTGIASFGQAPVAVIKAVSDYSDERKSKWPPGVKTLFQLYAAETAAEYVAQVLRGP